jgi:hypothetical protein
LQAEAIIFGVSAAYGSRLLDGAVFQDRRHFVILLDVLDARGKWLSSWSNKLNRTSESLERLDQYDNKTTFLFLLLLVCRCGPSLSFLALRQEFWVELIFEIFHHLVYTQVGI